MIPSEDEDLFLEPFNFLNTNLCTYYTATPDVDFQNEIKQSCERFVMMLDKKSEELKAREKTLERAQTMFNERVTLFTERTVQYQKTLNSKYEKKFILLEEKQAKLDTLQEKLERKILEYVETKKNNECSENDNGNKNEKDSVKKTNEIESVIYLDVGGKKFTTSLDTLCKDQTSMFAVMFSGRHLLTQNRDGSYFIDRDGSHFHHILNYLRGSVSSPADLPENQLVLNALRREADYFQLRGLSEIIEECFENSIERQDFSQDEITNMFSPITPDDMIISPNETSEHSSSSENNSSRDSPVLLRTPVSQNMTKSKLNFTNKKLNGISFAHTTFFHEVSFRNARLVGTSFYGCEFGVGVKINFNDADLTDCDFRQCKGKENGAKMSFAHGGGLLSASSSETFLQMIQEEKITFKRARIENTLFDPKVADFLNICRR